jgi:hypothetical protein
MKAMVATLAAAGLAALFAMPAQAADRAPAKSGVTNDAQVGHTDISARRYHRHRHYYGYRHRHWGPRYGYYRPYRPYAYYPYRPGVSFGFWSGPRLGVWF